MILSIIYASVIGLAGTDGVSSYLFVRASGIRKMAEPLPPLAKYDSSSGKQVPLEIPENLVSGLEAAWLDKNGSPLALQRIEGGEEVRIVCASGITGPCRLFQDLHVGRGWTISVSPDGKHVAVASGSPGKIAIGNDQNVHALSTKWWITRPLSWSPTGKHVAFYYALSDEGDDLNSQQHGVAVLGIDGKLRVILEATKATGTRMNSYAKDVPIGWDSVGRHIYYSDGAELTNGKLPSVSTTYRADIESDKVEKIAAGDFVGCSPDDAYLFVLPGRRPLAEDNLTRLFAKVPLGSREPEFLPKNIQFPRISPDGKLLAALESGPKVRFYNASDFKPVGQAIPISGLSAEQWFKEFRWIANQSETK